MSSHTSRLNLDLTVNVSVTGKRILPDEPAAAKALSNKVDDVLELIAKTVHRIYDDNRDFYQRFSNASSFRLRMISQLADGADRLVAQRALAGDEPWQLHALLPFEKERYKSTFLQNEEQNGELSTKKSCDEFEGLLKQAQSTLCIDCANEDSTQAYADASNVMLSHTDVLIALWDKKKTGRIAGTYATINTARQSHIPVIIINIDNPEEVELLKDFAPVSLELSSLQAQEQLKDSLLYSLMPGEKHSDEYACAQWLAEEHHAVDTSLSKLSGKYARKYRSNLRWHLLLPVFAVVFLIAALYSPDYVSQLKQEYARYTFYIGQAVLLGLAIWTIRHHADVRNSLVCQLPLFLVAEAFLLTILCLSMFHEVSFSPIVKAVFYFGQMILLVLLIWQARRKRNADIHLRYCNYRINAEHFRYSKYLGQMGFTCIRRRFRSYEEFDHHDGSIWFYRMCNRSKGLPHITLNKPYILDWLKQTQNGLIAEQLQYHENRLKRSQTAALRLKKFAILFFTFGCVFTFSRAFADIFGCIYESKSIPNRVVLDICAALALFLPNLAGYFSSSSTNSGHPTHAAISEQMKKALLRLQDNITYLQANLSASGTPDNKVSFTDCWEFCHNVDNYCIEEVTDWESTTLARKLKYV